MILQVFMNHILAENKNFRLYRVAIRELHLWYNNSKAKSTFCNKLWFFLSIKCLNISLLLCLQYKTYSFHGSDYSFLFYIVTFFSTVFILYKCNYKLLVKPSLQQFNMSKTIMLCHSKFWKNAICSIFSRVFSHLQT